VNDEARKKLIYLVAGMLLSASSLRWKGVRRQQEKWPSVTRSANPPRIQFLDSCVQWP